TPSFTILYTFWGGLVGGALIAGASHGTDHLIVQRLLAARELKDAQRALIGSGVFVILQIGLFLLVGTSLWLAGADDLKMRGDSGSDERSEEHTSELQSRGHLVCRLLLEKKKTKNVK